MSDYLLLTDRTRCPSCQHRTAPSHTGRCRHCGVKLFLGINYDFGAFERDMGPQNFWAFDRLHGWRHRDFFRVLGATPQRRELNLPQLPKGYGEHTTPQQVARRGGKLKKKDRVTL